MQRVRVQDEGKWRVDFTGVVVASFKAAVGASEHYLRHLVPLFFSLRLKA